MSKLNEHIVIHHVGGRAGSRGFPILKKFEKDIINVLYDADLDCIAQIKERNQKLKSKLLVLPYCLGDTFKKTKLNVNYDPYTSSLLPMNTVYSKYYNFTYDYDYIWSDAVKTIKQIPVILKTLDKICQSEKIHPPDFLSLDTQGSEYEIILGAKEVLKTNVLGLVIETEFHPIYKNQKLFGDLCSLLSKQGFDFVKFLSIGRLSPSREPIGLRGEGFQLYADSLFLKRIDNVQNYVMLRKLAFFAIVFNQFEYGLMCLRKSRDIKTPFIAKKNLNKLEYYKFLDILESKVRKVPKVFPPRFSEKYPTFEKSNARFKTSNDHIKINAEFNIKLTDIKRFLGQYTFIVRTYSYYKKFLLFMKNIFVGYSDIETFLIKYRLKKQAKILRKNRIIQSK